MAELISLIPYTNIKRVPKEPMTTPPTEDRDWKERFDDLFDDDEPQTFAGDYEQLKASGFFKHPKTREIRLFIEQEIAAAEARGEAREHDRIVLAIGTAINDVLNTSEHD